MLDAVIKYLLGELWVISQAPVTFAVAMTVIAVVMWKALSWRFAAKDDLIALYKARLDGASPDQARERIQSLEATLKKVVGTEWPTLTQQQIQGLAHAARSIEKRRIQVMYENPFGKSLARQIADAFEMSGWDVIFGTGSGLEDGIVVGRSPTVSTAIKEALVATTGLPNVRYLAPDKSWPDDGPNVAVFIGVGTNS